MEWQPISTAPKDGAALIYDPGNRRRGCEGAWSWNIPLDPNIFVALCERGRWTSDVVEFEQGWESIGSYTITQELFPTHWMPLPSPPSV